MSAQNDLAKKAAVVTQRLVCVPRFPSIVLFCMPHRG